MPINYKPLWKMLIDRGMKRTDLRTLAGVSTATLAKMGKDEYVSMEVIERVCMALKCQASDVMEVVEK